MKDFSKATPRPWRYEDYQGCPRVVLPPHEDLPQEERKCFISGQGPWNEGETEANSSLVVIAVNSFKAARELAELVIAYAPMWAAVDSPYWNDALTKAREVLKLMEGE